MHGAQARLQFCVEISTQGLMLACFDHDCSVLVDYNTEHAFLLPFFLPYPSLQILTSQS
jgi:hypothetical protein